MTSDAAVSGAGASVATMLGDAADKLFRDHCPDSVRIACESGVWPRDLWQRVLESGFTLALVPEVLGGGGCSFADVPALLRSTGRWAIPIPLGEAMVANWIAASVGMETDANVLAIPCGLAPASVERHEDHDSRALPRLALRRDAGSGNGLRWEATPCSAYVAWGRAATYLVMIAELPDGHVALARLPMSDTRIEPATNVAAEPRDVVRIDRMQIDPDRVRVLPPPLHDADALLEVGTTVRCQQMVGAMEWIVERTLAYARERVQFGKPIGSVQAVQHMLASMAEQVAAASVAADTAIHLLAEVADRHAASADASAPDAVARRFTLACGYAKQRVGEAGTEVSALAHQVHGAMGYTREYPLHWRTRRIFAWREEFGSERYWAMRTGKELARRGATAFWADLAAM